MLGSFPGTIIASWCLPLASFLLNVNLFPTNILEMLTEDASCTPRIFSGTYYMVGKVVSAPSDQWG